MLNKELLSAFAEMCDEYDSGAYFSQAHIDFAVLFMVQSFGLTLKETREQSWEETAQYVRNWIEENA